MTTALEEFRKICAVPRRSYHNEKIIDYCIKRAEELGLFVFYDEKNGNVLIRKDAAPGMEEKPGVVLQGHLDMVEQTAPGVAHDWDNEGIELIEEGDILTANGTTLGADDGVAPAIAFALLADETLKNPPLEVLLTTDEEVGMISVREADLSYLNGKYLFNLDSGGDDSFVNGCCGGETVCVWMPKQKEEAEGAAYTISVSGLNGGHSGIEIGMEKANALKVMGEVLHDIGEIYEFRITDLRAGGKDNAISKAAELDLIIPSSHYTSDMAQIVKKTEERLRKIYRRCDKNLTVSLETRGNCRISPERNSFDKTSSKGLAFLLYQLPFGVLHHDQSLDGSIETSCNLGLVLHEEDRLGIVVSIRSSVEERRKEVSEHIASLAEIVGAEFSVTEKAYPAWLPDPDSPLIDIFSEMYRKMYNKEAKIGPVHAGLECGYILKNSGLEAALAFGPEIHGEHTTDESLSISSLQKTFEFVKAVLESL
ncbi:MAG: beta-Ala-His dipeptidase [Parasporobacterium sp.]|nr:beta-Ala-His dipeptidase [Parasporobacterium sp.]